MSSVTFPANFSSKNITLSAPKTLQSGAKQAYLNYNGERLVMQTAVAMSLPFGLNTFQSQNGTEYSVDLSFRGHDNRPELKEFMKVLEQMDAQMIDEGVKNSKTWFKADLNKEVIKAFYTPSLKYSKDKEGNVLSYPPNIKVKLPKRSGDFDTKFYDLNGTPYKGIPVEDLLVKGVQVTAIIECGGVWFAGSKFGLTWRAKQIAIHKLPEKMSDFAFKGLASAPPPQAEEEEEEEVDDDAVFQKSAQASQAAQAASKPSVVAAMMPQQEEEEVEDGDDVEPMPAPKKTIIKKKVVVAPKK